MIWLVDWLVFNNNISSISATSWCYKGLLWSWSYGSWIYNYLYNQCLSPLMLWVRTLFMARCTRYNIICDQVCQWLEICQWFSPGTPVSFTNKTDHHDITKILLKVALNTTNPQTWWCYKDKKIIHYHHIKCWSQSNKNYMYVVSIFMVFPLAIH